MSVGSRSALAHVCLLIVLPGHVGVIEKHLHINCVADRVTVDTVSWQIRYWWIRHRCMSLQGPVP